MVKAGRLYLVLAAAALLLAMFWQGAGMSAASPQLFPVRFYQSVIGDMDGRSCPSYPVCSVYAGQAIAGYGWFIGSWLILDRLIHESDDLRSGPRIVFEGEARLHDPLHRNSFWLQSKGREE